MNERMKGIGCPPVGWEAAAAAAAATASAGTTATAASAGATATAASAAGGHFTSDPLSRWWRNTAQTSARSQSVITTHRSSVGSTHKGVNQHSKYVTHVQQQRPESLTATHIWHGCEYKIRKLHQLYILCTSVGPFLFWW